jgi:hypothetical protein
LLVKLLYPQQLDFGSRVGKYREPDRADDIGKRFHRHWGGCPRHYRDPGGGSLAGRYLRDSSDGHGSLREFAVAARGVGPHRRNRGNSRGR